MTITTAMIKELRERTGAGMMDCKRALIEAGGDIEAAIEEMRKKGAAAAEKKAGRIAAEGVIASALADDGSSAVLVEINCETDFVAKDDGFKTFANAIAKRVLNDAPADIDALNAMPLEDGGESVEAVRQELITKIGENMSVRRFQRMEADGGVIGGYLHGTRIGVLVRLSSGDAALGKDIAMHIAASRPMCLSAADMPADTLTREKEIYMAQAQDSGKPENIVEKMVEGRMRKFLKENTLAGQIFVKDPDQTVGKLLEAAGAEAVEMVRFEVGEGLEKRSDDFVAEVMAQAGA
ncbi:MAG: translation elongation factor Ts [Pseudomonadota bacterium]|nr:translation elongation factor Ts [Pseudomonadota bacterium]